MAQVNFGNQLSGSSGVQFPPANNKAVCRFQNTQSTAVSITRFYGLWNGASSTCKVRAVIYSDNAGVPATLLGTSNEQVGVQAAWNMLTFPTPVSIPAGAFVWIGVISDSTLSASCLSTGTIKYNADSYADGAAATFGTPTDAAFTYPMYVEGDDNQMRFGRASIDGGSGNYQPDREHGEKFVLGGTASVSVNSISTYIKTTSATVKSKAALFNDNAGAPSTKIAQTVEVIGSTANSWLQLNFSTPVVLAPGTYWLCFIASENLATPTIPNNGNLWVDGVDTEATAWTSPSTLTLNNTPVGIDIYASYSAIAAQVKRLQVFVCT